VKKGTEAAVLAVLGIFSISVCIFYLAGKEQAQMSRCGCGKIEREEKEKKG